MNWWALKDKKANEIKSHLIFETRKEAREWQGSENWERNLGEEGENHFKVVRVEVKEHSDA